jgi:hypothetical protein
MPGLDVALDKELQRYLRHFHAVEKNAIDVQVSHAMFSMGVGRDLDLVHAGEQRQQRVHGAAALSDLVEVDPRICRDHAGHSLQMHTLHASRQVDGARLDVGVDLIFGQDGRCRIRSGSLGISLDVVELALHAARGRSGAALLRGSNRKAEQNQKRDGAQDIHLPSCACVSAAVSGTTRGFSKVPETPYPWEFRSVSFSSRRPGDAVPLTR